MFKSSDFLYNTQRSCKLETQKEPVPMRMSDSDQLSRSLHFLRMGCLGFPSNATYVPQACKGPRSSA